MAKSSDEPVVKPTVEARQGEPGRDVNYVLIASLFGAVALLAVVYIYFFA
jgi:hypothetical protein